MDLELDAIDVIGPQRVLVAQLHAAVDAGMNHHPAGKGLVGVECNFEALTKRVLDLLPIAFIGISAQQSSSSLESVEGSRIAVLCKQCRGEAGTSGRADVKRLGHRAKLFAYADRLRRGDAQRHGALMGVEPKEAGARRGGSQHSR